MLWEEIRHAETFSQSALIQQPAPQLLAWEQTGLCQSQILNTKVPQPFFPRAVLDTQAEKNYG